LISCWGFFLRTLISKPEGVIEVLGIFYFETFANFF
jgi:hypothetical protein